MHFRSKLVLGALLLGTSGSAYAQDGIEVVTVTAAKREQNVQDVPISMEVIGQKKLEAFNNIDLQSVAAQIPGLTFTQGQGGSRILLRGFGSDINPAIDQTVAIYRDGIFMGRPRQTVMSFFDVQRVEVLRGPQGALVGKNSAAGAVSFISNVPTDTFEAGATLSYGFDRKGVNTYGYVNGPITDDLSARAAFLYDDRRGYLTNFATNVDERDAMRIGARVMLRFQPSEGFDNVTKFEYNTYKADGTNSSGLTVAASPDVRTAISTILATGGYNSPGLARPASAVTPATNGPLKDNDKVKTYDFVNTATVDFGDVSFVSITGYSSYRSDIVSTGRHANPETVTTDFIEAFDQGSQEFRLLSPEDQTVSWIVGAYFDYSNFNIRNIYHQNIAATRNQLMRTEYGMVAYTYSAYASATWNITDEFRVIGGVRGTGVHKSGHYQLFGDLLLFGACVGRPPDVVGVGCYSDQPRGPFNDSFTDSTFDPSFTIQYDVMPDVMVYGAYARGSKSGTLQGTSRVITTLDWRLKQEISETFEVGTKSMWWDVLTFNLTAYWMRMKNYQVQQFVQLPGEAFPSNRTANAAAVISRGFELQTSLNMGQWIEGLNAGFTGAYTDAYFDAYPGAPCTYRQLNPPTVPACAAATNNVAGYPLQYNSNWTGSANINYVRPITEDLKLDFTLRTDFRSKFYADTSNYNPNIGLQPGTMEINVRLALAEIEDKWSIAFIGENILDSYRMTGVFTFPGNPATVNVFGVTGGRSLSLQGSVKL